MVPVRTVLNELCSTISYLYTHLSQFFLIFCLVFYDERWFALPVFSYKTAYGVFPPSFKQKRDYLLLLKNYILFVHKENKGEMFSFASTEKQNKIKKILKVSSPKDITLYMFKSACRGRVLCPSNPRRQTPSWLQACHHSKLILFCLPCLLKIEGTNIMFCLKTVGS